MADDLKKYRIERISDPRDPKVDDLYENLMYTCFDLDEIDPPENTKRNLEKSLDKDYEDPIVILTIYHKDDEKPVAMIHANLLPDGHAAISYTATKEEHRRKGLAAMLVKEFEKEVENYHKKPKVIINEGRTGSEKFWDTMKYYEVKYSNGKKVPYLQPPVDYDEKTGELKTDPETGELLKEVPETLRVRIKWRGKIDRYKLKEIVKEGLSTMLNVWYLPKREDYDSDGAFQKATEYAKSIIQKNMAALEKSELSMPQSSFKKPTSRK